MRPHRQQTTRLLRPWDPPGKNTEVGCHFMHFQCMRVKSESEVAQSYLTLSDPMDCSLPGSSVHEIFQGKVLQWGAIAFARNSIDYLQIFGAAKVNHSSCVRRKITLSGQYFILTQCFKIHKIFTVTL